MNYTMMGEEVNLAARLESGAKLYGIYVPPDLFEKYPAIPLLSWVHLGYKNNAFIIINYNSTFLFSNNFVIP